MNLSTLEKLTLQGEAVDKLRQGSKRHPFSFRKRYSVEPARAPIKGECNIREWLDDYKLDISLVLLETV